LGAPYLAFNLGGRAKKLEPPATLAALERVSFADANAGPAAPASRLKSELLDFLNSARSLNRAVVEVPARQARVIYVAFLPTALSGLPVFEGDELTFAVTFVAQGDRYVRYGFRARPFNRLEVTRE